MPVIPISPPAGTRRVLADYAVGRSSGTAVAEIGLVAGFAGLIGLAAQVVVPLPWTPVPVTGQTFAVLLGAAVLGARRAGAGGLLYLLAGLAGVPWFAGWSAGYVGASFGYIVAFPFAAALVGWLADVGFARRLAGMVAAMVAGDLVVYLGGVPWLMQSIHVGVRRALDLGAFPFLAGDALKLALAAALVPAAWSAVGRVATRRPR